MGTRTKILTSLILLLGVAGGISAQSGPSPSRSTAPEGRKAPPPAWQPGDPADSLYTAAREALNRGDYRLAAKLFAEIVERFPDSSYAPDALYWQAFALYRIGGSDDLRNALRALELQRTRYPQAATRGDADALAVRIRGALAWQGDAKAAKELFEVANALTLAEAEVAKAVAEAQAEAARVSKDAVQQAVRQAMEIATKSAGWPMPGPWGTSDTSAARCPGQDNELRVATLNALLQMDADRTLPILRQILARRDECSASLRRRALFLVSQQRTAETEDLLLEAAREDPDPEVRRQAVFWLSQVPSERAVSALEEVLEESDDPALLDRAIFALSQHRSPRASQALRRFAEKEDAPEDLREKAVFWLGQHRSPENAELLRSLFRRTTSPGLKEKILFSLSQTPAPDNQRWLLEVAADPEEPLEVRKKALFWAGQGGAPIEDLLSFYDRIEDRGVREQLIFTYAQRKDPAAVEKLMEIVRTERDRDLRQKALFWLAQSDDPRVVEFFQQILTR
ncbi:MAG TPA: HEAT repeat domain-containing protein [Longimicrobiales bacterium]